MKKLSIFLVATIAVVAVFFVSSAFTDAKANKQVTYEYFQYSASAYTETDFETSTNWISLGTSNPISNPCASGSAHSCVVRVDQSQLSTNPFLTLPEKMALYLQNISGTTGASDYVNNASNYTYQKP